MATLLRRDFRPLLVKAGLPAGLRLYETRHTAGSIMASSGVQPRVLTEVLGNTDPGFTLKTYVHAWAEQLDGAAAAVEAAIHAQDMSSGAGK